MVSLPASARAADTGRPAGDDGGAELADGRDEDGEARPDSDDVGDCPDEDCDGMLIDVFDVSAFLEHNDPPPDVRNRMRMARDWRLGRVEPPPGLRFPRSEEDARAAFEEIL